MPEALNSVLIVEDEKMNIIALNKILSPEYSVLIAKNGEEALSRAFSEHPDLILLDILMPGISGYEVLERLKESDTARKIPVIIISGLNDAEDEMKAFGLGIADYITKPFRTEIVKIRVRNQMRLVEQMRVIERLGHIDPLTNIANRRRFDEHSAAEWKRAIREQTPISLITMDVDDFKKYNDAYGHAQGDILLKNIAKIFASEAKRPTDLAARLGGEEFAILLPKTPKSGALNIAEIVRGDVEKLRIPTGGGIITRSTISVGVGCVVPDLDAKLEDFINNVDQMCYAAKRAGKNTIRHEEQAMQ
ncbi:hypothetical protein FACS189490_13070 [Clostridia bacterium]|nr:hypothetical protein FACS189490_13070 [Clostridia bacterium]